MMHTICVSSAGRLIYRTILLKIGAAGTKDKVSDRRCRLSGGSIKEQVDLTIVGCVESWGRDISRSAPSAFESSVRRIQNMFLARLNKGVALALW